MGQSIKDLDAKASAGLIVWSIFYYDMLNGYSEPEWCLGICCGQAWLYCCTDGNTIAAADELQCNKKGGVTFWSPHRMSRPLSPLETEEQRREEIRRIILKKKGA